MRLVRIGLLRLFLLAIAGKVRADLPPLLSSIDRLEHKLHA